MASMKVSLDASQLDNYTNGSRMIQSLFPLPEKK